MNTEHSSILLAHDAGGSIALPIPFSLALIGTAWVMTAAFVVVAFAWKRPRFDPANPGHPLPAWVTRTVDSPVSRWSVALLALFFTLWIAIAARIRTARPPESAPRSLLCAAVGWTRCTDHGRW
jgi:hypothetical protein